MKYCGLVVDDCVLAPTTIGKALVWDLLNERCLSLTNAFEARLKMLEGCYSHLDIKNFSVEDLSLIIDAFRCLSVSYEINNLSNKIERLLEAKCLKATTAN